MSKKKPIPKKTTGAKKVRGTKIVYHNAEHNLTVYHITNPKAAEKPDLQHPDHAELTDLAPATHAQMRIGNCFVIKHGKHVTRVLVSHSGDHLDIIRHNGKSERNYGPMRKRLNKAGAGDVVDKLFDIPHHKPRKLKEEYREALVGLIIEAKNKSLLSQSGEVPKKQEPKKPTKEDVEQARTKAIQQRVGEAQKRHQERAANNVDKIREKIMSQVKAMFAQRAKKPEPKPEPAPKPAKPKAKSRPKYYKPATNRVKGLMKNVAKALKTIDGAYERILKHVDLKQQEQMKRAQERIKASKAAKKKKK